MKDTELEDVNKSKISKDRVFTIDTTFAINDDKGTKIPNDFDSIR